MQGIHARVSHVTYNTILRFLKVRHLMHDHRLQSKRPHLMHEYLLFYLTYENYKFPIKFFLVAD